jgi:hypothetical protein
MKKLATEVVLILVKKLFKFDSQDFQVASQCSSTLNLGKSLSVMLKIDAGHGKPDLNGLFVAEIENLW